MPKLVGGARKKYLRTTHYISVQDGRADMIDKYISVIGDKHADRTVASFVESPTDFVKIYTQLQKTVKVPIKVVFVVHNPYDIISTHIL